MANLFLAEDSSTHTALIRSLLEQDSHTVHCFENGQQALDQIDNLQPDAIITDMRMPEMNGLELVQQVADSYSHLPTIVVTARGSESLAVDALAIGATNFVPKNSLSTLLTHVVARTVELAQIDRSFQRFTGCLQEPEFSFTLDNHIQAIDPAAAYVLQSLAAAGKLNATQRIRFATAVSCAIFNAICFGNLEIDDANTAITRMLSGEQSGHDDLRQRANQKPYCDRSVQLKISVGDKDTRVLVSHDGPGRMNRMTPAPGTPESFELEQCRGLMLITSFMDDVVFHNNYREIVMAKNHAPTTA